MRRLLSLLLVAAISIGGAGQLRAFSLLGPFDEWQETILGYQFSGDIGGPQNLNEEYRWNLPVITYGVTPDFLTYFGKRGEEEIEKAVKIINELPRMSEVDLDEFPKDTARVNFRAQQLNLRDVKSTALQMLVEHLGLTEPSRFVFTLRSRFVRDDITNYFVIKRNFDPDTLQPSSFINGDLYTYTRIIELDNPHRTLALKSKVDPLALGNPVADLALGRGEYYSGLTRDDVGGLRYLYRQRNVNAENAPGGADIAESGSEGFFVGDGGQQGSPWTPVIPPQPDDDTDGQQQPGQQQPDDQQPGFTFPTQELIDAALRQGRDEIRLIKVEYDNRLGQFSPITNRFNETVITNARTQKQLLERELEQPDIVFDAKDLVGPSDGDQNVTIQRTDTANWDNNDDINGTAGDNGPGVITPPITITFNKVGPLHINNTPNFLSEENSIESFVWGTFDGTTNPPVVYPVDTEIGEVEREVLRKRDRVEKRN